MELNTMQNYFCQNVLILYYGFWPPEGKKTKTKSPHPSHEKFSILDGTKHIHKNFDILHFIVPN
jgi:hypothetical protein